MIRIEKFINELMSSNCYVVYRDHSGSCIIVDPGSERSEAVVSFIDNNRLKPEYIILTHEHTDHTWGCNTLIEKYQAKVVCSEKCKAALPKEGNVYFRLYYDDSDYQYSVKQVDIVVGDVANQLAWNGLVVAFIPTPGHSPGSVCFSIGNYLFTGDTIMQYKPFFPRAGSREIYRDSVCRILGSFDINSTIVCPGHGDPFYLKDYKTI